MYYRKLFPSFLVSVMHQGLVVGGIIGGLTTNVLVRSVNTRNIREGLGNMDTILK